MATQFLGSLMRLLSLLGLSYAAVATALTNVGFGGKRESYKHLQELDLGLDCDSHRLRAVAIAFVLGAQNLAAIPGGAPNLALARLAGWEYWLRGEGNFFPRRSRRSRCRAPTARRSTSSSPRSPSRARSATSWLGAARCRIYV